eukprot:Skav233881  [mRNA]  locus=scaffold435:58897:61829:- [translate_table: standard]
MLQISSSSVSTETSMVSVSSAGSMSGSTGATAELLSDTTCSCRLLAAATDVQAPMFSSTKHMAEGMMSHEPSSVMGTKHMRQTCSIALRQLAP